MYSQANVREESELRPPTRALPSVIVDTKKVLREADGPRKVTSTEKSASGGKVIAPGCASKNGRVSRRGARRSQAGRFGEKSSFAHRQVDEQPTTRSKTNNDKSVVAMLKKGNWQERESVSDACHDRTGQPVKRSDKKLGQNSSIRQFSDARQLGCVFQDMTPPKSILRKSTDMPKPIQRVKFTKVIARHTKIRDQNPPLGYICPGEPHERSSNAPKFEDPSQEETEWQEQGAREAAWKLAKSVLKSKEKDKTAFFSPSENWCLPAPFTIKPEEREFVVDSGASMHMISKKDLSDAVLDTVV